MSTATRFDAAWLMAQQFPPLRYVVPGIIPEGMTLVVAAPKIGKSWLVLGLSIALSEGGEAFGSLPVGKPRPVLYLALEDGPRRLQDRLRSIGATNASPRLEFVTAVESGTVLATINTFVSEHAGDDPVVFLDTLGKVMPPAGNASQYGHDYRVLSQLKALVDAVPGSSLVIVHHTRKAETGDFLDAVSGTQGIAGAADTVLVLRRERQEPRGTVQVTSRDAKEGEYALTMSDRGVWTLDGGTLEAASAAAKVVRASKGVGASMLALIEEVNRHPNGVRPKRLRELLPEIGNVDEYLRRAVESDRIEKLAHGLYGPVRGVSLGVSEPEPLPDSHTLTPITPPIEGLGEALTCRTCHEPLSPVLAAEGVHAGCEEAVA